jgi:enterochelin esterase family protein
MPLIRNHNDEKCLVVFIWQDPQGDELQSKTTQVILDVNSLTDHHSWEPECLSRVAGTDVWFGQLWVDAKWRGSYSFIPIQEDQNPEIVRKIDATREAQRAWWISVAKNQIHDDFNKSPKIVSGWGMSSPLHLPNATVELGWKEWEDGCLDLIKADQVHRVNWLSSILENERDCFLFSTAKGDAPLVVLLDGQRWGAESGTLSVLHYLTKTNKIAPAHYLLIPSIDGQTRWKELSCHLPFWQALIDELFPQVMKKLSYSNSDVTDYLVAGQSLGGLSALFAGASFPDFFSKVISLSGSFWWPEENRMRAPKAVKSVKRGSQPTTPANGLAEQIFDGRVNVQHLDVFLTVGSGEREMCFYNQATYDAIKLKGGNVHFDIVHGGHDWLSWRSGLINGLVHLLPTN